MTKITNNASLKAYIEKKLDAHKTLIEKNKARETMYEALSSITGLATATIASGVSEKQERLSPRNYALIQAAIERGEIL
jgi:hypothetical protein